MVTSLHLSSFPSIASYASFLANVGHGAGLLTTALQHEAHKTEYLVPLSLLLTFHFKGLGAYHFATIVPPKEQLHSFDFITQISHSLCLFYPLYHHVAELELSKLKIKQGLVKVV